MNTIGTLPCVALALCLNVLLTNTQAAEKAGTFKVVNGTVSVERAGERSRAQPGDPVMEGDRVITATSSFAGITLLDNTRLTAGPDSTLVIEAFSFDTTTHEGQVDARLNKGRLAVISGLLAKSSPDSVIYRTGSMTIGVRGTEFIIEAAGE